MSVAGTSISVSESITTVTVSEDVTTINIVPQVTTVSASSIGISLTSASRLPFLPYGTITATNVQDALAQLADQDFRTATTPTGINVQEGDTWYDTDDNMYKVYREISPGVFGWTNIIVANDTESLDAGAF